MKDIHYKNDILKALFLSGNLSTTQLAEMTGKSLSLIMKMIGVLLNEGLIQEEGLAPSNGGRRPATFGLAKDAFYIIAIAMDQFVTRVTILDAHRRFVLPIQEMELDLAENTQALQELAKFIQKVTTSAQIDEEKIIGIGIGMPGFIDPTKGINYTFLGTNIRAKLEEATGFPIFIENDSSAIALAEYKFGESAGEKNVLVINIGWGIGLGMIIEHRLFRGEDGFAGEFSHIPIFKNGKLCSCGKIGCLETETSLTYMLNKAREEIQQGKASVLKDVLTQGKHRELNYAAFMDAAKSGDPLTIEIISNAGYNIGRGIAILIHLINPGKIVLSGRCSAAGHIWLPPIQRAINEFCIPRLVSNTKIVTSSMSHNAEIIGSALLVIENVHTSSISKCYNSSLNS